MGFDPRDIKYILLSHGHYDHVNGAAALKELTGAKIFLGKDDLPLVTGEVNHFSTKVRPLCPDFLLNDGDTVTLGNTSVKCISTPGHSDGTMSFFFDVTDGDQILRAGMFGGAGTNTLTSEFLQKNRLPFENRTKFLNSIQSLRTERVDIFIGNHVGNNDTEGKLKALGEAEKNPFICPYEWAKFLDTCEGKLRKIIEGEKNEG